MQNDCHPLREYLHGLSVPQQRAYAAACNLTLGYLRRYISKRGRSSNRMDIAAAAALVKHSGGRVTFDALRPDVDWDRVHYHTHPNRRARAAAAAVAAAAERLRMRTVRLARSRKMLTAQRLRERLDYCPDTGQFSRKPHFNWGGAGRQAKGALTALGYVQIAAFGITYLAHRLAWLWVHGELPPGRVIHVNGNRADNRLENLRFIPRRPLRRGKKHPPALDAPPAVAQQQQPTP